MNKIINLIKRIFLILIILITVFVMFFTLISVSTFNRNDRSLFGYKGFIVLSDSMSESDINSGDLVIVKEVESPNDLKEGDIISYISRNPDNYGDTVTHMIKKIVFDENGQIGYITYGTSTKVNDPMVVTYESITGKFVKNLPNVGSFFMFLKTTPGYFICIFTPFAILICIQAWNTIQLFIKYRKEQYNEIEEERKRLEKEREELNRLRAQLKDLSDE